MSKVEFVELLKRRTKQLAVDIIHFYNKIQKTDAARVIGQTTTSFSDIYRS
jgi:hypothetical protein